MQTLIISLKIVVSSRQINKPQCYRNGRKLIEFREMAQRFANTEQLIATFYIFLKKPTYPTLRSMS